MGRKWGGKFAQFLLVSTWLSAAACVAPSGAAAFSVKDAAVGVWGTFSEWYDPGCPFVDDPGAALRQVLGERMAGQDAALKEVVDAVTEWHNASMEAGGAGGAPLVMAFSGTTGVGKTETAQTVADAVLDPSVEQEGDRPKGLLELDGNSYKDPQQVAVYQEAIKRRLGEHLLKCRSRAVVVLDEAQNCVPEVLDALKTSIQADRPHLETVVGGKLVSGRCAARRDAVHAANVGFPCAADPVRHIEPDLHHYLRHRRRRHAEAHREREGGGRLNDGHRRRGAAPARRALPVP